MKKQNGTLKAMLSWPIPQAVCYMKYECYLGEAVRYFLTVMILTNYLLSSHDNIISKESLSKLVGGLNSTEDENILGVSKLLFSVPVLLGV